MTNPVHAHICGGHSFKPGDPRPEGYMAFHEWAEVQVKAGIRQRKCPGCGLWLFPQEKCKKPQIIEEEK